MGKYGDYDDPAHDADMRALRREQLAADISPEEAAEECAYLDDQLDDWFDEPDHEGSAWFDEDEEADTIVAADDEEDRHWVVVHHQPRS